MKGNMYVGADFVGCSMRIQLMKAVDPVLQQTLVGMRSLSGHPVSTEYVDGLKQVHCMLQKYKGLRICIRHFRSPEGDQCDR
jgi:hypothetical protein